MYSYFEYGEDINQDVVHIETHAEFRQVEDAKDVRRYRHYYDGLVAASLTMDKSRSLIRELRDGLQSIYDNFESYGLAETATSPQFRRPYWPV